MSILNKIKNTVKSVASKASSVVSKVGNAITKAVGLGTSSSNATSLGGLDYNTPLNLALKESQKGLPGYGSEAYYNTNPQKVAMQGSNNPGSIETGGSLPPSYSQFSNSYPKSSQASITSTPLPVTISANTYGGSNNRSIASSSPSASQLMSPTVTRNIQNGTLGSSSLGSGTISGGVSTGVSPSSGSSNYVSPKIDNTKIAGAVAGYYKYNDKGQLEPVQDTTNPQDQKAAVDAKSLYDSVMGIKDSVYNDSSVIQAMKQRNEIKQALLAPTAELNAITAKQNQDLLQLRQTGAKEGVTEAVYGQQENAINYSAAIRALPIQASIANLQGQLGLAQDYLKELTAMKTDEIDRQYEYNKGRFQAISGAIETADKRAYETSIRENERQRKEQTDLENFKSELMKNALQSGASQFDLNRINTAKDKMSAIQAAGKYAVTQDNQIVKLDNGQTVIVNKNTGNIVSSIGGEKTSQQASLSGLTTQQANDPFIVKLASSSGGKPITDTFAQKLDKGLTVLNQIGLLQTNIKDVKTGPIIGAFRGVNPWDTNAQTIKSQLNAIVPNLARGVYGEVGVLTDNDIAQYSKTLPNLKSTEDIRNGVLGITVDLIGKSIKRTLEVNAANGKDVSGFIDLYTEMQNTRDSIFQQIPGYKGNATQSSQSNAPVTEGTLKSGVTFKVIK